MTFLQKPPGSFKVFTGAFFGTGYLPLAPGTWASLFILPLIYISWLFFAHWGIMALTAIFVFLSMWSAPATIKKLGSDPPEFVMDECAGQAFVFSIALPLYGESVPGLPLLLTGFILFRLFDIIKPFGIKRMEKFPGKYGILLDDLFAGFYASICLTALFRVGSFF